ncbi:MAG TPA: serine/threonine-protein kinase [Gemmatimonadaceae bacterium]|nr:serine/threonine-protein kinase [Gemmatimonadaceae bacterium]
MLTDPDFLALQDALAGQYSIERELGRGGMGIVYLAREVRLDRLVALKVLPPSLAVRPELRERFVREARASAKLSHPNIVPIHHVGEAPAGGPEQSEGPRFVYFTMAYVDGMTLGQRVRTRGPLSAAEGARVMREVAWALAYAHARGVIHRDVKPDNILLEEGSGRALVTDFGIALVANTDGMTSEGQVMGTAHFMSPEQAAGEPLDGRSDLYALGVVGYYALSGRLPFEAPTVPALLSQHLTQAAPSVLTVAPSVPRRVASVIDQCLRKEPAARYATGEALADALAPGPAASTEIPAPLRLWLSRGEMLGRFLPVTVAVVFAVSIVSDRPLAGFAGGLISGSLLALVAARFGQLRRVLRAGYGIDDLRRAVALRAEQRREERTFSVTHEMPRPARLFLFFGAALLGLVAAAKLSHGTFQMTPRAMRVMLVESVGFLFGGATGLLAAPGRPLDRLWRWWSERRVAWWNGRGGELAVRLAGFRLPSRRGAASAQGAVAGAHRTELALGSAVEALFGALPPALRAEFDELPAVVRALEVHAGEMRRRIDELGELLTEASDQSSLARRSSSVAGYAHTVDPSAALDAQRHGVADEVRAARDAAGERLATTVAAIEKVRLALLRLRAGAAGGEGQLTDVLDAARRLGADVALAGDAHHAVNQALARPATTPV